MLLKINRWIVPALAGRTTLCRCVTLRARSAQATRYLALDRQADFCSPRPRSPCAAYSTSKTRSSPNWAKSRGTNSRKLLTAVETNDSGQPCSRRISSSFAWLKRSGRRVIACLRSLIAESDSSVRQIRGGGKSRGATKKPLAAARGREGGDGVI